jgi:glutathione peroxidase
MSPRKDRRTKVIKTAVVVVVVLVLVAGAALWVRRTFLAPAVVFAKPAGSGSFYDLKVTTLAGQPADLGAFRDTVTLVVNVASKCGFTPQYEALEALHRELAPRGFSVLGFPSNDFGGQEPGQPAEIQEFCRLTYGVTFPMFAKVQTKAGTGQSPVYTFLGQSGSLPQWNFAKYVVGRDGKVRAFFPSQTKPDAKELRDAIEQALASHASH